MTYLQYYAKEREDFSQEFMINLDKRSIDKIIIKLIGHFKIYNHNDWRFSGGKSSHCVTWKNTGKGYFKFSKKYTSIGVICHELAHAIEIQKRGCSTHAKKHYRIMERLINYCRKSKYIQNLIKKNENILIAVNGKVRQGMSTASFQIGPMVYTQAGEDIWQEIKRIKNNGNK